jgi:hypothetical protein
MRFELEMTLFAADEKKKVCETRKSLEKGGHETLTVKMISSSLPGSK